MDRAKKIGYRYAFKTRRIELISERQRAGQMIHPEPLSDIGCPQGEDSQRVSMRDEQEKSIHRARRIIRQNAQKK